jgi:hypothetical protein
MIPVRQTKFVDTHPRRRGDCMSAAIASILELPLDEVLDTAEIEGGPAEQWSAIEFWLAERGYVLDWRKPADFTGLWTIGSGPSPRGDFYHAVVCYEGKVMHDPHPSDAGVLELVRHQVLRQMTPSEFALHQINRADDE